MPLSNPHPQVKAWRGDIEDRTNETGFDIMRRSIPYGPKVRDDELKQKKTKVD